jgi:hypothetical protein
MPAVADICLNTSSEMVKAVAQNSYVTAENYIKGSLAMRRDMENAGTTIFEVQFQPRLLNGIDVVTALWKDDKAQIPTYDLEVIVDEIEDLHYIVVDKDYKTFFKEQRFATATATLKAKGIYDKLALIKKVYMKNFVLMKEHPPQKYLTGGRLNPQYAVGRIVYTVSAGSEKQEEIIKFAPSNSCFYDCVTYGPFNPVIEDLLATPDNKATTIAFLGRAHFIVKEKTVSCLCFVCPFRNH